RKNRCEVSLSSTCQMHSFTCILSQTRTKREDPPSSARRDTHQSVPHRWVSQVETPRSPIGAFPIFPLCKPPGAHTPKLTDRERDLGCRRGSGQIHLAQHQPARDLPQ